MCYIYIIYLFLATTSKFNQDMPCYLGGFKPVAVSKYGVSNFNVWGSLWSTYASEPTNQGTRQSAFRNSMVEEVHTEKIWNLLIFIILCCDKPILHACKADKRVEGPDRVVCFLPCRPCNFLILFCIPITMTIRWTYALALIKSCNMRNLYAFIFHFFQL